MPNIKLIKQFISSSLIVNLYSKINKKESKHYNYVFYLRVIEKYFCNGIVKITKTYCDSVLKFFTNLDSSLMEELQNEFLDSIYVKAFNSVGSALLVNPDFEGSKFVPPNLIDRAYNDGPLPIGYGQTISQPYIVAYMTAAIELKSGQKVLEIGTGSGYQAAVLSEIVSDVYTIEIITELYNSASERLRGLGYKNVICKKCRWLLRLGKIRPLRCNNCYCCFRIHSTTLN